MGIRWILGKIVGEKAHKRVDNLKYAVLKAWESIDEETVSSRLRAIVKAKGGHIE